MSSVIGLETTKTGAVLIIDGENFRIAPMCHVEAQFVQEDHYLTCSVCGDAYYSGELFRSRVIYRSSFTWTDVEKEQHIGQAIQEWAATWLGIGTGQVSVTILSRVPPAR